MVSVRRVPAGLPHPRLPAEQQTWNIGGDTYPLIRAAMLLRERLRPYVMEQMKLASESGLPPMRPLFFDFAQRSSGRRGGGRVPVRPRSPARRPVTRFGMRRGRKRRYLPLAADTVDRRPDRAGVVPRRAGRSRRTRPLECYPRLHPRLPAEVVGTLPHAGDLQFPLRRPRPGCGEWD